MQRRRFWSTLVFASSRSASISAALAFTSPPKGRHAAKTNGLRQVGRADIDAIRDPDALLPGMDNRLGGGKSFGP